jgi:hypothetical protein
VNRLLPVGLILAGFVVLGTATALADDTQPFRTVVDGVVPPAQGLTIAGSEGGCDLLLDNQTGQDIVFFDMSTPPKPIRFSALPKSTSTRPAVAVHFVGSWPCVTMPSIGEDQRWNHRSATVLIWSMKGQVGALAFQLRAHTEYDPNLDPSAQWMLYVRIGGGVLAVLGFVLAGPWLLSRRREILGKRSASASATRCRVPCPGRASVHLGLDGASNWPYNRASLKNLGSRSGKRPIPGVAFVIAAL